MLFLATQKSKSVPPFIPHISQLKFISEALRAQTPAVGEKGGNHRTCTVTTHIHPAPHPERHPFPLGQENTM